MLHVSDTNALARIEEHEEDKETRSEAEKSSWK